MVISHTKKFIFIHNYKVAGTSVTDALMKYSHSSFLRSSFHDKVRFLFGKHPWLFSSDFGRHHITAAELKGILPAHVFNDYFKFGFVRDPWAWQVSLYEYVLKRKKHPQHELFMKMKSFDEYLDWRVNSELRLQKRFFFDDSGNCLMDYIGKFENLDADFGFVSQKLLLDSKLEHLNKTLEPDQHLKYYNEKTIKIVQEAFKEDILQFGYDTPTLRFHR